MRIDSSGNVGIGTTSPWRTLSVAGTVGFNSSLGTGVGGNYLCIDTTTYEVLRGNGSACTASSRRFKENIVALAYGLDEVLALHPVSYEYKENTNMGDGIKLGFIAEEVESILPEVVTYDNEGRVFGLDLPVFASVLTKAIQELAQQVTEMAQTLNDLAATVLGFQMEITTQQLNAEHIQTQELCIDDVCVDKARLQELLDEEAQSSPAPSSTTGDVSPVTEEPAVETTDTATSDQPETETTAEPTSEAPATVPESEAGAEPATEDTTVDESQNVTP